MNVLFYRQNDKIIYLFTGPVRCWTTVHYTYRKIILYLLASMRIIVCFYVFRNEGWIRYSSYTLLSVFLLAMNRSWTTVDVLIFFPCISAVTNYNNVVETNSDSDDEDKLHIVEEESVVDGTDCDNSVPDDDLPKDHAVLPEHNEKEGSTNSCWEDEGRNQEMYLFINLEIV